MASIRLRLTEEGVKIWRTGQSGKGGTRMIPGTQQVFSREEKIPLDSKFLYPGGKTPQKQGVLNER